MNITEQEIQEGSLLDIYNKIEALQSLSKTMDKVQKNEYKELIDEYNRLVGFKSMRV